MKYPGYHYEMPGKSADQILSRYNHYEHKCKVWNTFVDSDLTDVTGDDFSILPRLLPESYWPTLKRTAYQVTEFCMRLLSLPEREIRAILPNGPVRDHLLDELQVIRHHNGRITGSFRYDMAAVGPLDKLHPPQLLEINEIGFDGLARSTYFQEVLLQLIPELRGRVRSLDTAAAEIRNMRRLGGSLARVQYNSYNWDEEYLLQTADKLDHEIRLVSPTVFRTKVDREDYPLLERHEIKFVNGRATIDGWQPDAINMSFAYEMNDFREGHELYSKLVRSKTPQYGPFITGLIASKTILMVLADKQLRKKLLGSSNALARSILPAHLLSDPIAEESVKRPREWVLKYTDGCGGEQVFMNRDILKRLRKISPRKRHEWVLQKKTDLNLIDVNGISSRPKKAIADLGVFVQFDWAGGRFRHFEVGGLMARATNKSLKVNVSGGGLQVAVLLDKSR